MSRGRISVLVSKDLQTVIHALKDVDTQVASQVNRHTKAAAEPIWRESVRAHAETRLQVRVLSDTARVSVNRSNVIMRSAMTGKLRDGTPASALAKAVEYGSNPEKQIKTRSRTGTTYTRRIGYAFRFPRRRGYVVGPAVRDAAPRLAALWTQTAIRTLAEAFEKGGTS